MGHNRAGNGVTFPLLLFLSNLMTQFPVTKFQSQKQAAMRSSTFLYCLIRKLFNNTLLLAEIIWHVFQHQKGIAYEGFTLKYFKKYYVPQS